MLRRSVSLLIGYYKHGAFFKINLPKCGVTKALKAIAGKHNRSVVDPKYTF
jgi:hypothetical protein